MNEVQFGSSLDWNVRISCQTVSQKERYSGAKGVGLSGRDGSFVLCVCRFLYVDVCVAPAFRCCCIKCVYESISNVMCQNKGTHKRCPTKGGAEFPVRVCVFSRNSVCLDFLLHLACNALRENGFAYNAASVCRVVYFVYARSLVWRNT